MDFLCRDSSDMNYRHYMCGFLVSISPASLCEFLLRCQLISLRLLSTSSIQDLGSHKTHRDMRRMWALLHFLYFMYLFMCCSKLPICFKSRVHKDQHTGAEVAHGPEASDTTWCQEGLFLVLINHQTFLQCVSSLTVVTPEEQH